MSSDTKSIVISGAAAESYLQGGKTRRRRKQKGGQQQQGTEEVIEHSETDKMVQFNQGKPNIPKVALVTRAPEVPVSTAVPAPSPQVNITELLGGGKEEKKMPSVKVILEKTRKGKEKVVLAPAKPKVIKETPGILTTKKPKSKTLKASRRFRVSLDGLSKRMHRARTIKKETDRTSIDDIKKRLQHAGLIKKDSKAPEGILRQMHTDFEQLKQRAL